MQVTSPLKSTLLVVLCASLFLRVSSLVTPRHQSVSVTRTGHQFAGLPAILLCTESRSSRSSSICLRMSNEEEVDEEEEEEKNLLQKFNDFLDTPILDANNRSNEGPVKEALKEFARDEPELAQVSFSAVVIIILLLITKLVVG